MSSKLLGLSELGLRLYLAEGVGFEPTARESASDGFQDRSVQPLRHPSYSSWLFSRRIISQPLMVVQEIPDLQGMALVRPVQACFRYRCCFVRARLRKF